MTATNRLALPYIDAAQSQKHVTHNEALVEIDALVHLSVKARNATTPPATPAEGDRWLVGANAQGAFAGRANAVAAFDNGGWALLTPRAGWRAYVEAENLVLLFDGTNWNDLGLSLQSLQNLSRLGIGATADASNPLAAKLNGALLTARATTEGGTGDLRVTLNKNAIANTVSQIYQSNYSARAETGLTGDDRFHVKVSADGAAWSDALAIDPATGLVSLPHTAGMANGLATLDAGARLPVAQLPGSVVAGLARPAGPVVAIIGDSIAAANTAITAYTSSYSTRGLVAWWRILSGQSIQFPLTHNLGVAGDTLAGISGRIASILSLSPRPNIVVLSGGTNDVENDAVTYALMQQYMLAMITFCVANGVFPIVKPIPPRAGISTAARRLKALRYNSWLRDLGAGRPDRLAAAALPAGFTPLVIDASGLLVNAASPTGDPQAALMLDVTTHPNAAGGQLEGNLFNATLNAMLPARSVRGLAPADIYDAASNPSGNLLYSGSSNLGLMAGTSGTTLPLVGVTPTGQVATGWTIYRNDGTSSATMAGAKENPRQDIVGSFGERQRITINCTSTGGAAEHYGIFAVAGAGWNVGDVVYAECAVQVVSSTNLVSVDLALFEGGPANPQFFHDGTDNSAGGVLPIRSWSGVLRTPPMTIQSGVTMIKTQANIALNASGGAAACDLFLSDWAIRKIVA